ncbi:MAG: nucleoside-triphosphatase [Pseudonocardiaceae bacterium]
MRRLVELLQERGAVVSGFVTDEMRERDRRVGFVVRDIAGPEAILAHQDFQTGVQVGRFGVDVVAFERVWKVLENTERTLAHLLGEKWTEGR